MKKFLKTFLALGIAVASGLSFSACVQETEQPHETPDDPVIVNPDNPKDDPTPVDPTPEEPEEPVVKPNELFDEFLANLNAVENYTFTLSNGDKYLFDGDSMRVYENGNGGGDFFMYEDGVPYVYRFESSKGLWHKENTEDFDVDAIIFDDLFGATLTEYDTKSDEISVSMDGRKYVATLNEENLTMTAENGDWFEISEIGSTKVSLPNAIFIVDDTEKEPENPPITEPDDPEPDEPEVEEDLVYTLDEQGNRVYDSKVLAEVFLTALNSTREGETQTVYGELIYGLGKSVDDVKFVSTEGDTITFGALATAKNGVKNFAIFNLKDNSENNIGVDKTSWLNYLSSTDVFETPNLTRVQYTTDDAQYGEIVETAFENVANKLAENGVQDRSINTLGTPITKLKNSDVVWAYSIEKNQTGVGYDIGNTAYCGLAGVVLNSEGDYEYFETAVVSRLSASKSSLETVAEDGVFIVTRLENNIKANNDFYKAENTKSIDLYNEKEGKGLEL